MSTAAAGKSSKRRRSASAKMEVSDPRDVTWTFFSNHAHVMICLSRDTETTVREIATQVGITERAVLKILGELEDAGFVTRTRDGRRNHYELHVDQPLRHPLESHRTIGDVIRAVRP